MTVRELALAFDTLYPRELSCEWDNDGLLLSPAPDREVHRILTVLDVTERLVNAAKENGFDVIISHHPLIFRPLKSAVLGEGIGGLAASLLTSGISLLSYHTRADAADGGVADLLARLVGLSEVAPFADGIPRIGKLRTPTPSRELAERIKHATGAPFVRLGGADRTVSTVALCPGSGDDYIAAAAQAGAELYLSGELGYHALLDADHAGLSLVEIGHDYSEMQIVGAFAAAARRFCPGAKVTELVDFGIRTL